MFNKRIILIHLAFAGAIAAFQLTRGTSSEAPINPPPYTPAVRDKDGLISAAGLVEASAENTLLGSPTSGTVQQVHVKVWDKVKAGDALITLDDREWKMQYQVQLAAVEAAEARRSMIRNGEDEFGMEKQDVPPHRIHVRSTGLWLKPKQNKRGLP